MIGILIFPGFQLLDATGPAAVFEIARRYSSNVPAVRMITPEPGAIKSSSGIEILASGLDDGVELSTLIVAGGEGITSVLEREVISSYLRMLAQSGVRIASVCSGAYLLAQAGLLEGLRATTHWSCSADFASRYPNVKLEPESIFVCDSGIWTSAGISAGIDLALAIIGEDCGDAVVARTAHQLVLYNYRSGTEPQISTLLEMKMPGSRFNDLLLWIRENLTASLTVDRLAEQVGMSPRHFSRMFHSETGMTPAKAIERMRVEVARQRVEASDEVIELVAYNTGFGDPERMRRAFMRAFGQPPRSLRRTARSQ